MIRRLTRRERRELARQQKRQAPLRRAKPSAWNWIIPSALAFLAYARELGFMFINDDVAEIKGMGSLWTEISQPVHVFTRYYRPVVSAFSYFVHLVAGLNPSVWHASSVLLHVLATFALYWVAIELLGDAFASSCASCLFAIHPAHIEAISWVSANSEPLYTIFSLCACLCFLIALRTQRSLYTWLALIAWLAMLFSKETAIALVPVFFLLARRRLTPPSHSWLQQSLISPCACRCFMWAWSGAQEYAPHFHGSRFCTRVPSWASRISAS